MSRQTEDEYHNEQCLNEKYSSRQCQKFDLKSRQAEQNQTHSDTILKTRDFRKKNALFRKHQTTLPYRFRVTLHLRKIKINSTSKNNDK